MKNPLVTKAHFYTGASPVCALCEADSPDGQMSGLFCVALLRTRECLPCAATAAIPAHFAGETICWRRPFPPQNYEVFSSVESQKKSRRNIRQFWKRGAERSCLQERQPQGSASHTRRFKNGQNRTHSAEKSLYHDIHLRKSLLGIHLKLEERKCA